MNQTSRLSVCRIYSGFTLLEMAFVLLVMGIVASMLIPTVADIHHKSMVDEDRKILSNLKEVIIGQFLASGKLPACKNSTGAVVALGTGGCDTVKSLGNLGVRITDSRNKPIRYEVWNVSGSDLTATDFSFPYSSTLNKKNVCSALDLAGNDSILAVPTLKTGPAICRTSPDYDVPATWTTYCKPLPQTGPQTVPATHNVAFVLVASGATRPENYAKEAGSSSSTFLGNMNENATAKSNRIFENPVRAHNETWHYDDVMEVVTFQQLRDTIGTALSCVHI